MALARKGRAKGEPLNGSLIGNLRSLGDGAFVVFLRAEILYLAGQCLAPARPADLDHLLPSLPRLAEIIRGAL